MEFFLDLKGVQASPLQSMVKLSALHRIFSPQKWKPVLLIQDEKVKEINTGIRK